LLLPLVMAALAVAAGCGGESAGEERSARPSPLPVERLRDGGYVLAFRHAATDSGIDTTNDLTDCSRQRNLSAEGRRQARSIGHAFRRLRIPVGRVLASPFCRTRDTARLAFGRARASRALLSVEFFANADVAGRKGLRPLLSARPRPGTNTVLVSHGSAIDGATGVNPDEGDVAIILPRRGGRDFEIVSTVKADEWPRAARGR